MIKRKIGVRIRELRTATGLSQEKFALKIGMDRTYLASVELGNRNISIVNLEKIVRNIKSHNSIADMVYTVGERDRQWFLKQ